MELSLLADVGGTNSRVALAQGGRVLEESVARFANAGRSGLAEILGDYVRALSMARTSRSSAASSGSVRLV